MCISYDYMRPVAHFSVFVGIETSGPGASTLVVGDKSFHRLVRYGRRENRDPFDPRNHFGLLRFREIPYSGAEDLFIVVAGMAERHDDYHQVAGLFVGDGTSSCGWSHHLEFHSKLFLGKCHYEDHPTLNQGRCNMPSSRSEGCMSPTATVVMRANGVRPIVPSPANCALA